FALVDVWHCAAFSFEAALLRHYWSLLHLCVTGIVRSHPHDYYAGRVLRDNRRMGTAHKRGIAVILDALRQSEPHPATRRLIEAFGGEPVEAVERHVGAPAFLSRRLRFASGGEIILHGGTVVS